MRACFALLLLLGAGCVEGLLQLGTEPEQPFCDVETPCRDASKQCIFNRCFDPQIPFERVALNLHRDHRSQQLLDVDLSNSARLDLSLLAELTVDLRAEGADGRPMPGRVIASRQQSIPGAPVQRQALVSEEGSGSLVLTEGTDWQLRFYPEASGLPPTDAQILVPQSNLDGQNVLFRLVEAPKRVTGRLLSEGGLPLAGRSLRLQDVDGHRVSGRGQSDEDGRFELLVREDVTDVRLLIDSDDPAVSGQLMSARPVGDGAWGEVTAVFDGPAIPVAVTIRSGQDSRPLACDLVLRPAAAAGLIRHRIETQADVPTMLQLAQGSWWVDIHPRGRDDLAPVIGLGLEVAHLGHQEMVVTLAKRVRMTGSVLLSGGQPAAGARLVFQQFMGADRSEDLGPWGQQEWILEHQTDENGRFELSLPPGEVALFVVPSAPYPRLLRLLSLRDELSVELQIEEGTLFSGEVSGHSGGGNTLIQVFSRDLRFAGRAVLLGEGIAGGDGSFSIPLPAGQ
ncbi:MAG: hypothetical protein CMH55_03600 [Myxococcales bacterium]|nr:hypothetical protein [Myxococcales bacterium]